MPIKKKDIRLLYLGDTGFYDLLDILGPEKTKLFLWIWGGTTIKVPNMRDIQNCDRDYEIYKHMSERIKQNIPAINAACECANKFKCQVEYCLKTYRNLKKFADHISSHRDEIEKILKG